MLPPGDWRFLLSFFFLFLCQAWNCQQRPCCSHTSPTQSMQCPAACVLGRAPDQYHMRASGGACAAPTESICKNNWLNYAMHGALLQQLCIHGHRQHFLGPRQPLSGTGAASSDISCVQVLCSKTPVPQTPIYPSKPMTTFKRQRPTGSGLSDVSCTAHQHHKPTKQHQKPVAKLDGPNQSHSDTIDQAQAAQAAKTTLYKLPLGCVPAWYKAAARDASRQHPKRPPSEQAQAVRNAAPTRTCQPHTEVQP
jgi:hypothetical protein